MSDVIDCMTWDDRIINYERVTGFPRSMFVADDGRVVGTWIMGNDYRVKSEYYGGYPAGYLRAVQRSLLWWHGPGESEMPHTDANRPVIANWWFPRRGAI